MRAQWDTILPYSTFSCKSLFVLELRNADNTGNLMLNRALVIHICGEVLIFTNCEIQYVGILCLETAAIFLPNRITEQRQYKQC